MISPNDTIVTITDLETLKIISDPLRLNIIQIIKKANQNGALCSVKQISEIMDIPPAKLYYHVKLLEKHGFLDVAETRIISGIVEKLYAVKAYQITVSNELFLLQDGGESIAAVFANLFNTALSDMQRILQEHKEEPVEQYIGVAQHNIKLTVPQREEFQKQLDGLARKYAAFQNENTEDVPNSFNFIYALYPSELKESKPED